MAFSVQMPALGESVTEGTVTRWLKAEGDTVEVDEPLLEVSTDKVDTEIPSPVAGTLQKIVAGEDETVEVGGELAVIGDGAADEGSATPDAEAEPEPAPEPEPEPAKAEEEPAAAEEPAEKPKAATGKPTDSGTPVTMPELGESVTEGVVTRWLKQVGDTVEVDEPLLEVSTDKVDTEIPSPVAGTVLELSVGEDDTVEVGGQLALIGDADAASAESEPEPAPKAEEKAREKAPEKAPEQPEPEKEPAPQAQAAEKPAPEKESV
ncbi:biotin/lipoyl-containing protein, partial [Pseudonocardia pini]|uniref:biotin/lipoyl-containing protein n=1 Tax=Pseudonocardia pini TaxID=2758030 RepID=UPI0028A9DCEA